MNLRHILIVDHHRKRKFIFVLLIFPWSGDKVKMIFLVANWSVELLMVKGVGLVQIPSIQSSREFIDHEIKGNSDLSWCQLYYYI